MNDMDMLWAILKLLCALPVVILLAYISLRLSKGYLSKYSQGKNIQVLERIPVNNKATLCVAKIGEDYMVLGVSENNFQVIKTLNEEEALSYMVNKNSDDFSQVLKSNLKKFKKERHNHE